MFLTQSFLTALQDSQVGNITWSNHSPVGICMKSSLFKPRERTWRLNKSLLLEADVSTTIKDLLTQYFIDNADLETTQTVLWEAHKSVIRRRFIAIGANRKKARSEEL
ncbi:Hypothetical predicted protein [Pelobates cultripes]|uniref:Uncharacterized protein n=1 Tax=Pelobates cultripes TaxID=61616 RepID=A0AAD1R5E5_PELCU|nr:Hypothetical predicted protein [Pelobates cultripes]